MVLHWWQNWIKHYIFPLGPYNVIRHTFKNINYHIVTCYSKTTAFDNKKRRIGEFPIGLHNGWWKVLRVDLISPYCPSFNMKCNSWVSYHVLSKWVDPWLDIQIHLNNSNGDILVDVWMCMCACTYRRTEDCKHFPLFPEV